MKIPALICVACVAWAVACHAQAPTPSPTPGPPPLPPGPLIQKSVPAPSEWSVTCKYGAGAADSAQAHPAANGQGAADKEAPNPRNKMTLVTKTGNVRREATAMADNTRVTVYFINDMKVTQNAFSKTPILQRLGAGGDFQGFGWISEKNFTNIVKVQDRDCLIFRGKAEAAEQDLWRDMDPPAKSYPAVAVIDLETRLPVSIQIGDEVRTYHHNPPPATPLVLPPEVQKVVDDRINRVKAESITMPHP